MLLVEEHFLSEQIGLATPESLIEETIIIKNLEKDSNLKNRF